MVLEFSRDRQAWVFGIRGGDLSVSLTGGLRQGAT